MFSQRTLYFLVTTMSTIYFGGVVWAFEPAEPTGGVVGTLSEIVDAPAPRIIVKYVDNVGRAEGAGEIERSSESVTGVELRSVRDMSGNAQLFEILDVGRQAESRGESTGALAAQVAERLSGLPEVEYAEVEQLMQPQQVVNDPRYGEQWHYTAPDAGDIGIDAERGWINSTGVGVVVAVIDTGILPHQDLAGQILPGFDFITSTFVANDGDGRDNDASDPGDWRTAGQCGPLSGARNSSWHGTHVGGTIAAVTNNGIGVAGVAPGARLLPVRVLGRCGGSTADIFDAIRWSAGLAVPGVPANANPAKVLNLSLGGGGACSAGFQDAIDDAVAAGSTVVVSAGNSDADAANFSPASCDSVLSVAATNREGGRSFFGGPGRGSNFGAVVDIAAPGGETFAVAANGVLSTLNTGLTTPAADGYAFYQGTSMAAPHVAGVAALVYQMAPTLTPAQVMARLESTATPFPAVANRPCTPATCGTGIVDAEAATDLGRRPQTANTAWMRLLIGD